MGTQYKVKCGHSVIIVLYSKCFFEIISKYSAMLSKIHSYKLGMSSLDSIISIEKFHHFLFSYQIYWKRIESSIKGLLRETTTFSTSSCTLPAKRTSQNSVC